MDTVSLLPHLGLATAQLDTLRVLRFTLMSERDLQPLLFLGYAQDVTVEWGGPPARVGSLVAASDEQGQGEPRFFRRQEGYAGHTQLSLTAGQARVITLRFRQPIDKPTPRAVSLMAPGYLNAYANYGFSHFGNGMFQGMIWILILYHLLLFWTVRVNSYLWYCAYMVCISALTSGDVGYWQRGIFRDHPLTGWHLYQIMQYVTGIMTLVFMRSFVNLRRLNPRGDHIVRWFIIGNLLLLTALVAWYLPTGDGRGLVAVKALIIPFAIFGLWVCYVLLRSGDIIARYFAVAGAFTAVAVALNAGAELFFPEQYPGTDFRRFYWIQAAVILHLLTFALGMGYRRRQRDLELQRTRELDDLKTRFYANITHEFRTPLTVIIGMADQVENNKTRTLIRRNADQLLRLINQLLGLSRIEARQLRPEWQDGEVIAYLRYLTESFTSLASDKSIRLIFYTEIEARWMRYDPEKLQHVVANLLSNAIKFTPAGGQVVLHVAETREGDSDWLQLKVRDTGIGIPAADRERVFDRFFRVEGDKAAGEQGTGIGLAYVRELVRLLGGSIDLESQEDKGSTFRVLLPLQAVAPPDGVAKVSYPTLPTSLTSADLVSSVTSLASESYQEATTSVLEKDERPLILLVDDNDDVVTYLESILKDDYRLALAADGRRGAEKAGELIPDLIVSDIMMPEMNGYEMCTQLRQDARTSHIPIILLTAKVTMEDKLAGLDSGADVFLTKPFHRDELLVRIENLLANRQALRQYYAREGVIEVAGSLRPDPEAAFLHELESAVEKEVDNPDFGVSELASTVAMSQSQVYRKLKAVVGKTPSQFIRGVRLKKGRALLADPSMNIAEIAYAVGFADPNYFSRTFNEAFGSSPSDWRRKRGITPV